MDLSLYKHAADQHGNIAIPSVDHGCQCNMKYWYSSSKCLGCHIISTLLQYKDRGLLDFNTNTVINGKVVDYLVQPFKIKSTSIHDDGKTLRMDPYYNHYFLAHHIHNKDDEYPCYGFVCKDTGYMISRHYKDSTGKLKMECVVKQLVNSLENLQKQYKYIFHHPCGTIIRAVDKVNGECIFTLTFTEFSKDCFTINGKRFIPFCDCYVDRGNYRVLSEGEGIVIPDKYNLDTMIMARHNGNDQHPMIDTYLFILDILKRSGLIKDVERQFKSMWHPDDYGTILERLQSSAYTSDNNVADMLIGLKLYSDVNSRILGSY